VFQYIFFIDRFGYRLVLHDNVRCAMAIQVQCLKVRRVIYDATRAITLELDFDDHFGFHWRQPRIYFLVLSTLCGQYPRLLNLLMSRPPHLPFVIVETDSGCTSIVGPDYFHMGKLGVDVLKFTVSKLDFQRPERLAFTVGLSEVCPQIDIVIFLAHFVDDHVVVI